MAISLTTIQNQIRTSIFGRRLGLGQNDTLDGARGVRLPQVAGTSDTTGTELPNHGFASVVTSTNDTWRLAQPYVGAQVTLMTGSSSTGIHSINLNGSVGYSTIGIAGSTVTLTGAGASLTLLGISTAIWQQIGRTGSSDSAYLSS